jgi:hypothetical protein
VLSVALFTFYIISKYSTSFFEHALEYPDHILRNPYSEPCTLQNIFKIIQYIIFEICHIQQFFNQEFTERYSMLKNLIVMFCTKSKHFWTLFGEEIKHNCKNPIAMCLANCLQGLPF